MLQKAEMTVIARIRTDFATKFGVPRQSGLVPELEGEIVFEPSFRQPDALRELEGFSHLWLIWLFSEAVRDSWTATVRPPRLGGNRRVGVFASRSPFRPSPLGLSCVRLQEIVKTEDRGYVLRVRGADLMDGTPILDIKPYLPETDAVPDATDGFAGQAERRDLRVVFPEGLLAAVPEGKRAALMAVLRADPRPSYQDDPGREYGFVFAGTEIRFSVSEGVLTVSGAGRAEAGRP